MQQGNLPKALAAIIGIGVLLLFGWEALMIISGLFGAAIVRVVTSPPMLLSVVGLVVALLVVAVGMRMERRDREQGEAETPFAGTGREIDLRLADLRDAFYQTRQPLFEWPRVQIAMMGVPESCQHYYREMILTERSIYKILEAAPVRGLKDPGRLMNQVQQLSRHIAVMVVYIQQAEQLFDFYAPGARDRKIVEAVHARLTHRADRALQVLQAVPARLLHLTTASGASEARRLCRQLEAINTRLGGAAESFDASPGRVDAGPLGGAVDEVPAWLADLRESQKN
jgi:hypothetical protein